MGNFIVFFNGDITPPSEVKPVTVRPKAEETVVEQVVEDNTEIIETDSVDVKALLAEASTLLDEADKKVVKTNLLNSQQTRVLPCRRARHLKIC